MEIKVTVFTPTYNRGDTISKCYESLKKQTIKNFEWIVIDDGSNDCTELILKKVIENEREFSITYIKQPNGGKHRAINSALKIAKGKLFFIVDSDDYITVDAIEKILKCEKTIHDKKEKFAGIALNKGYDENKLVGTTFRGEFVDASTLERKKYNINGDKAEVFYTDILRKNKFPEFKDEKFVTEALVWNRIARQGYKLRWFQDIIYICEYRDDGLTKQGNKKYKNSPNGLLLYINECMLDIKCFNLLKRTLLYEYYSNAVYDNKNIRQAAKDLNTSQILIIIGIFLRIMANIIKSSKINLRR